MDLMTRKLKRFALESVLVPRARPALDPDFSLPNNADQEVKKRSGNEGVQLGYRQTQSRSRKRPSDGWAGKAMNFYSHSDGG